MSIENRKTVKIFQTSKVLRVATPDDLSRSRESFKAGEFAGHSPAMNECGFIVVKMDGRELLCYIE